MSSPRVNLDDIDLDRKVEEYNPTNEGIAESGLRQGVRSASRFAEGALGTYGDTQNLRKDIENSLIETGTSYLPENFQKPAEELLKAGAKGPVRYIQEKLIDQPFGSTDLFRQASEEITNGYTKPTGDLEKQSDEVFTLAGSMMLGGTGGVGQSLARRFFTNLGLSALNKVGKKTAETMGAGKIGQEAAGFGSMLLASFLNRADPRAIAQNFYQVRDRLITPNTMSPSADLNTQLLPILNRLRLGNPNPSQRILINQIEGIMGKAQPGGGIPVEELTSWQQQLSKIRQNFPEIRFDNREITPIQQANQAAIARGLQNNPVALNAHRNANEAFAVGAQTNRMQDWINGIIPAKLRDSAIGHALGMVPFAALSAGIPEAAGMAAQAGGVIGAASLAMQTGKVIRHIWQSPVLRREYERIMRNIIREDAPAVIKGATEINKKLDKDKKFKKDLNDNDRIDLDML